MKDLSTEDVRIAIEMKKDADEKMIMAYLFKHTPLQINFAVNLTCLIPTENPEVGRPERLDLKQILWHFLHFRLEVVTRRLEHELAALKKRIHILEGFEKVFDALDEIIRIIRKSDGKADAAEKIMQAVRARRRSDRRHPRAEDLPAGPARDPDHPQRARREAQARAPDRRAAQGRGQPLEAGAQRARGDPEDLRRSQDRQAPHPHRERHRRAGIHADDFIVEEDNVVIVSRDGWVKRQKDVKDVATTRLREGDAVLACLAGSTRATCVFFTNFGVAYTCRIIDVPASTGYGEPIQRLFKLKDGEKIVAALSLDPRATGDIKPPPKRPDSPPPVARGRRHQRRLHPAIRPRSVRRAEHARRPALRPAGGRAPKSSGSRRSPAKKS